MYESVSSVCLCPMNLCCVYMYEHMLYCSHVWMAPGKISCKLTGSPSLYTVFELKIVERLELNLLIESNSR